MQNDSGDRQRTSMRWIRVALVVLLATACWLSRMSLPHDSVTVQLDPTYQQALGYALSHGLRFGRDIVFTSGPLAYFMFSPYDAELYASKLWLWEGLLGSTVALLLFSRLVQRGTWIDIAIGALFLIVLPKRIDEWLFVLGLLAADVAFEALGPAESRRFVRVSKLAIAFALLAILTLIKVTSLTLALGLLGVIVAYAAARGGIRSALRVAAGWVLVEVLLWFAIGQNVLDLPLFFSSSIELASGFSSAMSLPPAEGELVRGLTCLVLGAGLCAATAFARGVAGFESARAQALAVLVGLFLAFKAGFTRADHLPTFFSAAMILPTFLIPLERPARIPAWRQAGWRVAVALLTAWCAFSVRAGDVSSFDVVARGLVERMQSSLSWITRGEEVRAYLENSRARLAEEFALPRIRAIVQERGIDAFTTGHGVLFLNDLTWKPRPVFQSFSVFTQSSARANADFLASAAGPDFVLLKVDTIDRRLPSSEDPLSFQELLRGFHVRESEDKYLLLERNAVHEHEPRAKIGGGTLAWNEPFVLPAGTGPLVLRARIRTSLQGRALSALYQTPEVFAKVELDEGHSFDYRIAPFALEAGVCLRPWLPTIATWLADAGGESLEEVRAIRFHTATESAFAPTIEVELLSAPDLRQPQLAPARARELKLGAACDPPLRFESEFEPELEGWVRFPVMVYVRAPLRLFYAAGPGKVHLTGMLSIPPELLDAPGFSGERVTVLAHEGDEVRACAELTLGAAADQRATTIGLDVETTFGAAGELELAIQPLGSVDPESARIGIRRLRVER